MINEESLFDAISFVCGMDIMLEESILYGFREWLLTKKLKKTSPFSLDEVVQTYLESQGIDKKKQAVAFLDLVFEFLEDKGITDVR